MKNIQASVLLIGILIHMIYFKGDAYQENYAGDKLCSFSQYGRNSIRLTAWSFLMVKMV